MNLRIRYAAYSLLGISIAITLLLAFPEVNRSRAKARAVVPAADLSAGTPAVEGGSATLSPAILKTWTHINQWHGSLCSGDFVVGFSPEEVLGTIVAGYTHTYDKGKPVLGCPSGNNSVHRGSVWFDLSDIAGKAPPLHVSAKTATLHFKRLSGSCPGELLVGTADWMKGYSDADLVPGDSVKKESPLSLPLNTFGSCGAPGCSMDVKIVVNNWLKGAEHGGYPNYGFVIKGMTEADAEYSDNDSCLARYGDFSLTIDYTYDKEPAAKVPESYPLECRGTDTLKVVDLDGPAGFRWVGFTFIPGTKAARDGLLPGQCSWLDRGFRAGEPGTLAQPIEGAGGWMKELNSSDSYWTFNVYNAGKQLQVTGAERSKKFFVPLLRTNYALASNLGKVVSSTTLAPYAETYVNDGDRTGAGDKVWLDSTLGSFPDYIEIDLDGKKTIDEIDVITRQDDLKTPGEPSLSQVFTLYGITAYDVLYWDGGAWVTVPDGHVGRGKFAPSPNDKVWRQLKLATPVVTDKIRIQINGGKDNTYSRVVEVEAWGK